MSTHIGPYAIEGTLGRGGVGAVFRARGPLGEVALKLLHHATPETLARFERERRLQAGLGLEEGFVPLLDVGQAPGGPYLVMPLLAGGTLRQKLERGPLGIEATIALGRDLTAALARAHERGIVHRDLKPENILFSDERPGSGPTRPLIADLGLAKHFRRDLLGATGSASLTRAGAALGTVGYMPIEQLDDAGQVGPPADVFALGAILHECLAGKPAFPGENVIEVMGRLEKGAREPLRELCPGVPAWLDAVIARALERDPGNRFADARALGAALSARRLARRPRRAFAAVVAILFLGAGAAALLVGGRGRLARDALARAEELHRAGLFADALREASRAVELDPGLAHAWAVRADEENETGDLSASIADATHAIGLDPGDALAWCVRGCSRCLKGERGAIADIDRALELDPKNAESWNTRGTVRCQMGDLRAGLSDFERATTLDPGLVAAWVNAADMKSRLHDDEGTFACASRAIELGAKQGTVYCLRGILLGARGQKEESIRDFTRAIELEPRAINPRVFRASARLATHDLAGARDDLRRALEIDPRSAPALEALGALCAKTLDYAGTIDACTRLIAVSPRSAGGWADRGWAREKQGDHSGSLTDLDQAAELAPGNATIFTNRAATYIQLGHFDAALADTNHALELKPGEPWALTNRGSARTQTGDPRGGLEDCERAVTLMPNEATMYLNRALARQKLGDIEGGFQDMERALEIAPDHPNAKFLRDTLATYRATHPRR